MLYMFRTPFASIIRSTINCNSSYWCLSCVGMMDAKSVRNMYNIIVVVNKHNTARVASCWFIIRILQTCDARKFKYKINQNNLLMCVCCKYYACAHHMSGLFLSHPLAVFVPMQHHPISSSCENITSDIYVHHVIVFVTLKFFV